MTETKPGTKPERRYRTPLLWLAGARAVLGVVAIPLAPFLYKEHFIVLVLLRPTKEVLLAGGFLVRQGDVNPVAVVAAAIPLAVLAVWQFFWLGRSFADEIQSGTGLPKLAERLLPRDRIQKLCAALDRRGRRMVFLGRLASFPSSLLGAAAGASAMEAKAFLPADAAGAMLSVAEVMIAGYLLGSAYKTAGPWLTAAGVAALLAMLYVLGRSLTRDSAARTRP